MFPKQLANLGFTAHSSNGVEYILPPLCTVPAGPFLMGSDSKRDPVVATATQARRVISEWESRVKYEQPQKSVTLPAYEIARFPVTVAEYACFVQTGQPVPECPSFEVDWPTQLQRLDHPVVWVSWHDARNYVSWLSHVTGQVWRLPSEAEWEKAARGSDGRLYPWGDEFEPWRCNTQESSKGVTTPVGTYAAGASPYGTHDMAGNVWEWTASLILSYPYTTSGEREVVNATDDRVLRGGS